MNWKIIWQSLKKRDMQKRLLAVLGILLVYRFLAHIPIPLSSPETLKQVLKTSILPILPSSLILLTYFPVALWLISQSC